MQRIESLATGRGIPDLYVANLEGQYWIELKYIKKYMPKSFFNVPWRIGQQRWMYIHYKTTKVPAFTLIGFYDAYALIPHVKMYPNNNVHLVDVIKIWRRLSDIRL